MNSIETTMAGTIEDVEPRVREAFAAQGFGILTEIDVAATLKAKIDVDRPPLKILGACNPHLANDLLEIDTAVALLLPCNVVLEATGDGSTRVSVVDPRDLLSTPGMDDLACDAADKLTAAIDLLS